MLSYGDVRKRTRSLQYVRHEVDACGEGGSGGCSWTSRFKTTHVSTPMALALPSCCTPTSPRTHHPRAPRCAHARGSLRLAHWSRSRVGCELTHVHDHVDVDVASPADHDVTIDAVNSNLVTVSRRRRNRSPTRRQTLPPRTVRARNRRGSRREESNTQDQETSLTFALLNSNENEHETGVTRLVFVSWGRFFFFSFFFFFFRGQDQSHKHNH